MAGEKITYDFLLSKTGKRIARLMVFLCEHDNERFTYTELKDMKFFSSSCELSNFLRFAEETGLIRKTIKEVGNRTYSLYEIKIFAHVFVNHLKDFIPAEP